MKYVYPAIFTPEAIGYSIHFPDLESCFTQGENLDDGIEMAEDVLCLTLYDMELEGKEIPTPSDIRNLEAPVGGLVTLIRCNTRNYRMFYHNKAVKKTLSIPEWLNEEAMARGINFSAALQEALKKQLEM